MSDLVNLPTREQAREAIDHPAIPWIPLVLLDLGAAYASGRLVDLGSEGSDISYCPTHHATAWLAGRCDAAKLLGVPGCEGMTTRILMEPVDR